jgi:hypothetical protein
MASGLLRDSWPGRAVSGTSLRLVNPMTGVDEGEIEVRQPLVTIADPASPRNAMTDARTGLRYYDWAGRRLPSVTTIRRLAGLPHGLHQWAIGQVIDHVVGHAPAIAARVAANDPADIALLRHELRAASTAQRDLSAELGTAVHAAAADRKSLAEVRDDVRPRLRQYQHWEATSRCEVLASEFQVWNLTVGYAGTADLLVRFPDGSVWIIDLKTGKGVYGEHALQLIGYMLGEFVGNDGVVDEEMTALLRSASGMAVLHLEDAEWQFYSLRADMATWGAFRGLLAFGSWMAANQSIESVSVGSRKGWAS